MKRIFGQVRGLLIAAAFGIAAASAAHAAGASIPAEPESGTFKLGIEPWLGYGQWYVAQDKGTFKKNGLDDVEIVNFTEDKDLDAALASGQLDAANVATHTAMAMVAAGLPLKIVMLLDVSMTADAIIVDKDVDSIKDLKGKQVAFEQGTTSDILLKYALQKNGMSIDDVKPVPMAAADAGSALIAGRVPVAVTYEPYLTIAMKQNKDMHEIFTAGEDPGLISDVLLVREEVIKNKPGQVAAMIRSWDEALQYYRAHTDESRAIISKAVGSTPDQLETAFNGVRYYSLAQNKEMLTGSFAKQTFADVEAAAKNAGLLRSDVSAEEMIDPDFVEAVTAQ